MTSVSWAIELLNEDDLVDVTAIEIQSSSPWTMRQLEDEVSGPEGWRLAGREREGSPIRGYLLARNIAGEAEILRLAVDRHYRRQGLASKLLQVFFASLAKEGISTCHLELRSGNRPARRLYDKSDFVMTGVRKKYYTDPTDDAITMTRTKMPRQ